MHQQPALGPEVRPVFGPTICDRNRPERIVPWPTVTRPRRRMKPGQHQAEARPSPDQAAPGRKLLDHQSLVARGQYVGGGRSAGGDSTKHRRLGFRRGSVLDNRLASVRKLDPQDLG
jgi:hypothetical protein